MIFALNQTSRDSDQLTPDGEGEFVPSPDEIARRSADIRRQWSDAQRKRRRVVALSFWLPPQVGLADIAANIISDEAG